MKILNTLYLIQSSKNILRSAPKLYTLYFILTILTTLPLQGAGGLTIHPTKKIDANPVNLALSLVEHTDSAKIASILAYHGYKPTEASQTSPFRGSGGLQSSPFRGLGDFSNFQDTKGNEISFTFTDAAPDGTPTVIVKTKESSKSLDTRLKDMKFVKTGGHYERQMNQYSKHKTTCTPTSGSTLTIRHVEAPRPPKGGE